VSVSSKTQLLSALKTVKAGDTVQLAPGDYGAISLDGMSSATKYLKYTGEVKIVSADIANQAVIDDLNLRWVSNLTFENIKFDYDRVVSPDGIPMFLSNASNITFRGDTFIGETSSTGYGMGSGFKVSLGSNILLENSTITGFRNGIETYGTDGITVRGNVISDIAYDGMINSNVQGLTILNNTIAMRSDPAGDQHRDGIQVWNQHERAPASNITISGNTITSTDSTTHGIYMGNSDAQKTGLLAEYYSNVTITNNIIMTGQKLGIAIGETNGLTISGNTLIQNGALDDNPKAITIPIIHVEQDARNVNITNNIVNGAPLVTESNWQAVTGAGTAWTISGNKVVALNWNVGDPIGDPWAGVPGNGLANEFRFKGTSVTADRTDLVTDLLFSEGDTIVLINYEANTFKGVWQGNPLDVNSTGTYVKINSVTDLQELVATSTKLTASVIGDDLTIHIDQTNGDQHIVIDGLGTLYQSTYDATLF
jgi:hypothetical protein